ncbi:MAG: serine/threonine protein kinase [Deltaproteobacteria bacterium]|nr:serine/threonine protein kinase [Deltaproteobacteria bacterium]
MTLPARDPKRSVPQGVVIGGRYGIEALLGEGSSSTVFRATHVGTGRAVAVKFLHASLLNDPIAVKRFAREARAASRVQHPNVVDVLDAGIAESGRPYLVTELLEGETLAAALKSRPGPWSVQEVASLLLPLLEALALAHEGGVIHRDVKPENIFLHAPRGGRPTPKLLDFGVSKILRQEPGRTLLTIPGEVFGTPLYMSPEQALSARDTDARTDVWSVGVLLYRMLVGKMPFEAPTVGALLQAVHHALPTSPTSLGVHPAVSAVILQCLAKLPSERFLDARVLKNALCAALGLPPGATALESPGANALHIASVPPPAPTMRPPRLVFSLAPQSLASLLPEPPPEAPGVLQGAPGSAPPGPGAALLPPRVIPSRVAPPTSLSAPKAPPWRTLVPVVAFVAVTFAGVGGLVGALLAR